MKRRLNDKKKKKMELNLQLSITPKRLLMKHIENN
jgi:hypothetical protein